jgi:hypothetical protein
VFLSRTLVHRQQQRFRQQRRRGGGDNNGGCSSDAPGAIQGPVPTNFPALTFTSGTSLLPNAADEGGAAHGGTMRTLKPNESEDFYFRGQQSLVTEDPTAAQSNHNIHHHHHNNGRGGSSGGSQQTYFCRLCQEDVVPPFSPRSHILASSRTTHTNHSCRETVLDTLAIVLARGYTVDHMATTWARLLFHHPRDAFPRIGALSDPTWSLAKRGETLLELLKLLTDVGVLDITYAVIAPDDPSQQSHAHRRRIAMERTECIGDNSWGHHMSHRMITLFPDRQFLFSQFAYSYNCFRDACEMNVTLEWIYDVLQISLLFPVTHRERIGNGKMKADILEAMLGELHLCLFGFMPQIYDNQQYVEVNGGGERLLSSIIEHVMTEIFDMIMLHFVGELLTTAVPLAKEIAVPMLWRTARVQLSKMKDRTGSLRRRNQSLLTSRVVQLPPLLSLSLDWERRPTSAPHPLRQPAFQLPETTVCNGQDALQDMIPHLLATDSSEDFKATGVIKTVNPEHVAWLRLRESLQLGLAEDSPLLGVDDEELYFRDPYFNLTTTATASSSSSSSGEHMPISSDAPSCSTPLWHAKGAYPFLQEAPTVLHDALGASAAGGAAMMSCCFEPSRWVPSDVKPPVAGVVTEKNLHHGMFFSTALQQWSSSHNGAKTRKAPLDITESSVSTTTTGTAPSTNTPEDLHVSQADTAVASSEPSVIADPSAAAHPPLSDADTSSSILERLVKEWQQRCSVDNDYFPVLMTGLRLHVTPQQSRPSAHDD